MYFVLKFIKTIQLIKANDTVTIEVPGLSYMRISLKIVTRGE